MSFAGFGYDPAGAAAADAAYGFPPGTMEALAATESSYGTNLGPTGNVYQVQPATAADPGYGLAPLNGNSAMSAGGYLSALLNGPAAGDLGTALEMYHGGAANPTPYAVNSPIAAVVPGAAGNLSNPFGGIVMDPNNPYSPQLLTGQQEAQALAGGLTGPSGGASQWTWYEELAVRALLILCGIVLIATGLIEAGSRGNHTTISLTEPGRAAARIARAAT